MTETHHLSHLENSTDEEDDFMSDKFLVSPAPSSHQLSTYSDQRKRKQLESLARSQKRSRAEREIEAREEGLSRDLIADQLLVGSSRDVNDGSSRQTNTSSVIPSASHSKAVQMMLKMGFQPGKALGAQSGASSADEGPQESNDTLDPRPHPSSTIKGTSSIDSLPQQARTAPIEIQIRTGRSGIGVLPASGNHKPRPRFAGPHIPMTEEEASKRADFFQKSKAKFDGRKVEGILSRARRTCEELDRRHQLQENVFWLDPFNLLDQSGEVDEEPMGSGVSGRRLRGLSDPKILEQTVVETEDEGAVGTDEREAWLGLDSRSRLLYTLQYLREEHFYCIWCGCQYTSLEEMNAECPGEDEDDH